MRILFRVDATDEIGSGHFMRCLNLADALKRVSTKICFISRNLPCYLEELLAEKQYEFLSFGSCLNAGQLDDLAHSKWLGTSQAQDALETIALSGNSWDWIVVDHYGIDARWETKLRLSTNKILVIDDLADREHDCDVLLDQNLFADADTRYISKVPVDCVLLLGSRFALLHSEFVELRKHAKARTGRIKRILIFFGSVDSDNHTAIAIKALENINASSLMVDVVISIQNPFLEQIKSLCISNKFTFHVQTRHMATLIQKADFAIGAGGISTYERLFLRLRAILKPISFNQIAPLTHMNALGLIDLFSSQKDLENKLQNLLMKKNFSPPDCVEDGASKLAKLMTENITYIKPLRSLDIRRTYGWLQNTQLRNAFMIAARPLRRDHFLYWRNVLNDPTQSTFAIYFSGKHVGNCGLKNIDVQNRNCEIWIYLAETYARGRGVASIAIHSLLEKAKSDFECQKIYLHVSKTNFSAINLYKKKGFFEVNKLLNGRWAGQDASIAFMERLV